MNKSTYDHGKNIIGRGNVFTNFILALFVSVTVGFFAPIEIYLSNKDSFWFDIYHILPLVLPVFVFIFVVVFGLMVLTKKRVRIYTVVYIGISLFTLLLYLQGNFIVEKYGALDGREIDWNAHRPTMYVSWFVWFIVILLVVFLLRRYGLKNIQKWFNYIFICILLVQIGTITYLSLTKDVLRSSGSFVNTDDGLWEYSSDINFVILLLDYYDSEAFDYILNNPNGVDYLGMLDGFTFYRNTLGSYNCTDMAVPQILTGREYKNEEPYGQYVRKAYRESVLLNELKNRNYEISIYTDCMLPQDEYATELIHNYKQSEKLEISSKKKMLGIIYGLVGFRYTPQPLKQFFWFYPDEIEDLKVVSDLPNDPFTGQNKKFYDDIPDMTCNDSSPKFKFIHLSGTHVPHRTTADFDEVEAGKMPGDGQGPEAMVESGRGLMVLVDRYIQRLKEEELYDNSVILIMADHGGDYKYAYDWRRECPLFMVKGADEHHNLVVSDTPFTYYKLDEVWTNLINGNSGDAIFDPMNIPKERIFRQYWWEEQLFYDSYGSDIIEFKTVGHAYDYDSLVEDGIVYKAPDREGED